MSRPVEETSCDVFWLCALGQDHRIGLLTAHVGVKVDDLDAHLQIVEERHYRDLVGLLVQGLHLGLAEEFDGQPIVDEGLVENGVVLELPRSEESHDQNDIVRDGSIAEDADNVLDGGNLDVIKFLDQKFQHVFEDDPLETGLQQEGLGLLQLF